MLLKEYGKSMMNYVGVISEESRDHFKILAESLDGVKADLSGVKADLSGVKTDLGGVKVDLKEIKQIVSSHTEMIGQLLVDMNEVKNDLKTKVNYDDFAKLDRRLRIVETKLARP